MPCYLFTYHAFGSWMPDRQRGYVRRGQGILAPDTAMAKKHRAAMQDTIVTFDSAVQLAIIEAALESREKQRFEAYYFATESTHAHLLIGWRDERPWLKLRSIIKGSLTRQLNSELGRREWFVEGGSRKRVRNRAHFDYLVTKYLPNHSGWKWEPKRGKFR